MFGIRSISWSFLLAATLVGCASGGGVLRRDGKEETKEAAAAKDDSDKQAPAYRQVRDDEEGRQKFTKAKNLFNSSRKIQGIQALEAYMSEYPDGEFFDDAGFTLAQYFSSVDQDERAKQMATRVIDLDPPSPFSDQARFLRAKALFALGDGPAAEADLNQVNLSQLPRTQHSEFFEFWGRLASSTGNYRDASLAYIKAMRQPSIKPQERGQLQSKVDSIIQTQLGEAELRFLLQEYPDKNGFPSNALRLRLAKTRLAQGNKSDALMYLNHLAGYEAPSSSYRLQAQQMIANLQNYGGAASFKVGALFPLSGRLESWGERVREGLELAFSRSGLKTSPQLIFADTGPSMASMRKAFERLVVEERVLVVVGPVNGDFAEEAAKLSGRYGVPFISLSPRSGILELGAYSFRFALSAKKQVEAVMALASGKLEARSLGILFPEDNFGMSFAKPFYELAAANNLAITAADSYPKGQKDFQVPLRNMVGTAFANFRKGEMDEELELLEQKLGRPPSAREKGRLKLKPIIDFDVLFIPDTYRAVGQILPSLAFEDIQDIKLVGPSSWRSKQLLQRAGQYMENAYIIDSFSANRPSQLVESFLKEYRLKFGRVPNAYSALGFDAGVALTRLFARSGEGISREEIRAKLESLGSVAGVLGQHHWDQNRDALGTVQLFQVRRSRFHYVGDLSLKPRL